ncbi:hypothetical protein J3A83DRAFT_4192489 [Scleroderma citrinum]
MALRGNFKGMGLVVPLFLRSIALARFDLHIKLVGGEKALQGFVHQKLLACTFITSGPLVANPTILWWNVQRRDMSMVASGHWSGVLLLEEPWNMVMSMLGGQEGWGMMSGWHMSATDTQGLPGVWTVYLDMEWLYVNCCEVKKSSIKVKWFDLGGSTLQVKQTSVVTILEPTGMANRGPNFQRKVGLELRQTVPMCQRKGQEISQVSQVSRPHG